MTTARSIDHGKHWTKSRGTDDDNVGNVTEQIE
jgi:hypothetical protein